MAFKVSLETARSLPWLVSMHSHLGALGWQNPLKSQQPLGVDLRNHPNVEY